MSIRNTDRASRITALKRAQRWAHRLPHERWQPGKQKCKKLMLEALYSALPPKRDGTHPLDGARGEKGNAGFCK